MPKLYSKIRVHPANAGQNLDRIGSGLERAASGEERPRLVPVDRYAERFDIARLASGENLVADFGDWSGQQGEIADRGRNRVVADLALGFTDHAGSYPAQAWIGQPAELDRSSTAKIVSLR